MILLLWLEGWLVKGWLSAMDHVLPLLLGKGGRYD